LQAAICFIPLPQRVWCPAELRPRGEETVYVTVDGRLEDIFVEANDRVSKGDELGQHFQISIWSFRSQNLKDKSQGIVRDLPVLSESDLQIQQPAWRLGQ
jgi:hypothetical protein